MTRAIVVDIEGTTSSTDFVTSTLFPYARARFATYIAAHRDSAALRARLDEIRNDIGAPHADDAQLIATLEQWSDADKKVSPLKAIQGWIWQDAFANGELTSHFYPDVIPALRRWHGAGLLFAVFSSGSVDAQRAWFGHSPEGDLLPLLSGNFDTENAGPKREADSYRKIAAELALVPEEILFLSDVAAELDAARNAGWITIGVRRAGEPSFAAGVGDHREIHSFDEVALPS